jgi:hypothetical protein
MHIVRNRRLDSGRWFTLPLATVFFPVIGLTTAPAKAAIVPSGTTVIVEPTVPLGSGHTLILDGFKTPLTGSILVEDLDASSDVVGTTAIFFDTSGSGNYNYDYSYLGYDSSHPSGSVLVDVESLLPGLNLTGELGGGPTALDPWVSEHTAVGDKIIWSFSDGTVITVDTNPAEIEVDNRFGHFSGPAPVPYHEPLARVRIQNNTNQAFEALLVVPEPTTAALITLAAATLMLRRRRTTDMMEQTGSRKRNITQTDGSGVPRVLLDG